MSYRLESARPLRLESPRPRSALPPLRIRSPGYTPSSATSPTTLLYDLPQPTARSPPPDSASAPYSPPPHKSPSSPTQSRQKSRATPPPHPRSATPAPVTRHELDQFAAHCRAWYFDQDEQAGQLMTQTVEALPAPQRAPFSRVQSSIRSAYHAAVNKRRKSEFKAHLSSTNPGGSLSPHARAHPASQLAKKERFDKFHRFLRTWCITGMPGTRPFFRALWALLRLQVLPVELGGAGSNRIEWELDDAVFQESAGKEFMLEAIDTLKGVLGFDEYLPASSRRESHELQSPTASTPIPPRSPTTRPRSPTTRPRSPSDPFLDTPALSYSATTSASRSSTALPASASDDPQPPASPGYTPRRYKEPPDDAASDDDECDGAPYMRVWSAPDLDNPELQRLLALFPAFLTREALPRFHAPRRAPDLEEGMDIAGRAGEVRCGSGRLWVGDKARGEGWQGSWWQRLTGWWRRLFC